MVTGNTRHLAAIMFTDIAGYTALMQRDEAEASSVRSRHIAVIRSSIDSHGGRLIQAFGDGTLSVFPSAIECVSAAIEVQKSLRTQPQIPLRIGIHVGDITYDEQGVYGDAVNIASRLEAIGKPGCVIVSERVVEELRNHPRFSTVRLGEARLKNVERPVLVFAIDADGIETPQEGDLAEVSPGGAETSPNSAEAAGSGVVGADVLGVGHATSPDFFDRLRHRKIVQWGLAYLAGAWLALQAIGEFREPWGFSGGLVRNIHVVLALGLVLSLVLAWYHGERGKQRFSGREVLTIAGVLGAGAFAISTLDVDRSDAAAIDDSSAEVGILAPTSFEIRRTKPAIAVLPFDNISPDPNDAHFADGLQEEIISQLYKVSRLTVVSRSSTTQFRDVRLSSPEMAQRLSVHFLLEGSVRKSGDELRMTVQLINGSTDAHLWSESFNGSSAAGELLRLQLKVANLVAASLSRIVVETDVDLGPPAQPATAPPEASPVASPLPAEPTITIASPPLVDEAYLAFLDGRARLSEGWGRRDVRAAEDSFEKASRLDPNFAEALGWLAYARSWLYSDVAEDSLATQARDALRRAQDLEAGDFATHLASGWFSYLVEKDLSAAASGFMAALELRPNDPDPLYGMASIRKLEGDTEGASEYYKRVVEVDLTQDLARRELALIATSNDTS